MKKDLSYYYPNTKPGLTTIAELEKHGKAVEFKYGPDNFGLTEVYTINIFGQHQMFFIKELI